MRTPRIIITSGDVNGIGLRCLAGALQGSLIDAELWLAIAPEVLRDAMTAYGLPGSLTNNVWSVGCHVVHLQPIDVACTVTPGVPSDDASRHAVASLDAAITSTVNKTYDAVVTLPISKNALTRVGWTYPGQTEMLGAYSNGTPLMVLCTYDVRVALATVHVPLRDVSAMITPALLKQRVEQLSDHLRNRCGIAEPSIAVLAVNPHAGDSGVIGDEDDRVIAPTIEHLRAAGHNVSGPHPADGFFAFGAYKKYDGILAMYHDQGLIPLKLIAQGAGVNVTAGLTIIRTSPDHGTAYDLAINGEVDAASTRMSIDMALSMLQVSAG